MSSLSQDSPSAAAPDILVTGASGFIAQSSSVSSELPESSASSES